MSLVLLVDDSDADNVFHKIVLKRRCADVHVEAVTSVDAAVEFMKGSETKPALIFLDINMPGKDGWAFLDEFHALPTDARGTARICMLTTSSDPSELARAADRQVAFYTKPLTDEILDEIVSVPD